MPERITRVMCQFCRGGGVVWSPKMAVQWGSQETFSLAAPTRCPECQGDGWFEMFRESEDRPGAGCDGTADDASRPADGGPADPALSEDTAPRAEPESPADAAAAADDADESDGAAPSDGSDRHGRGPRDGHRPTDR